MGHRGQGKWGRGHGEWETLGESGQGEQGTEDRQVGDRGQGIWGRGDRESVEEETQKMGEILDMERGDWGKGDKEYGGVGTGRLGQRGLGVCGRGNSENGGVGVEGVVGDRGLEIWGRVDRRMGENGEGIWGEGGGPQFLRPRYPNAGKVEERIKKN